MLSNFVNAKDMRPVVVAAFVPNSFCFFVHVIICALAGNSGVWHRVFLPEMRPVEGEGLLRFRRCKWTGRRDAKMPNLTLSVVVVVSESNLILNLVLSDAFL